MATPAAPFLWTTTPQRDYPTGALGSGVQIDTTVGSFSNSLWVEVIAATPELWFISGLAVTANSGGLGMTEFDIGIGAAGSETAVATIPHNQASNATLPLSIPGQWVPSGSRVAVRLRCASAFAGFHFFVSVLYYPWPFAGNVIATENPLVLSVPSGGTSLNSSATPWLAGAWVQITAATLTSWVIQLAQMVPVAGGGSVPVQAEIDIGTGAASSEVVATTIRWSSLVSNLKDPTFANLWPLLVIPSGVRVAARLRTSDSQVVNFRLQLAYIPSDYGLSTVMTTQATAWYPPAASSPSITTPASAWVNSAWVQAVAATATAIAITSLAVDGVPTTAETEFDIGQGAGGSEVVIGTFRLGADQANNIGSDHTILQLLEAQQVAAGVRLAIRARSASAVSQTLSAAIGYIANPTFSQQADNPQHSFLPAANGVSLAAAAVGWSNTAWGEVIHATAADVLLTGVSITNGSTDQVVVEIATGAAGSESIITLVRCITTTLTNLWFALPIPHYVASGERLAVRFRQGGTSTSPRLLDLTYLGVTQVSPPVVNPVPVLPAVPTSKQWRLHRCDTKPRKEQTA